MYLPRFETKGLKFLNCFHIGPNSFKIDYLMTIAVSIEKEFVAKVKKVHTQKF